MEEIKKAYLDSNVFIYSAISLEEDGKKALDIIGKIVSGKIIGYTSALVFDEVFWKIKKLSAIEKALEATETMLNMMNLKFLDMTLDTAMKAHNIMKQHRLDPRDALHAAVCLLNTIPVIISDDQDFDKLPFLKRKPL